MSADCPADAPAYRLRHVLVVGWLALQVALPLGTLFERPTDGGRRFGWGMYATSYDCRTGYTFHPASGAAFVVDPEAYFNDPRRARRVYHRDALPGFHAWLCERLLAESPGRLEGLVACSTAGHPPQVLVEPGVDLCSAAGGGVVP